VSATSGRRVRIVVADDSTTARRLLVSLCERDPGIEVVGEAANGAEAVRQTMRLSPDLVLMDVHMPVLDGLEATKQIMRDRPTPIIMVTAGTISSDVEAGLSAVRFGALTVVPKPVGPGVPGFESGAGRLTEMVKALSDVKVIRRGHRDSSGRLRPPATGGGRVIAVAASTGGPPAVCEFLQHLPVNLPVPVVLVQHIVEGFLPGFAAWLRNEVPFHVTPATHGQRLEAGTVYLAPDSRHLEVTKRFAARLTDAEPVSGFRPSATVLFTSLAQNLGSGVIAVVLTGMGQDGLEGARAIRAAGGRVLVQDEASCVVYGMPRVVAMAGLAHLEAPVAQLAVDVSAALGRPLS
jgi:two-component system chemotaxis response regulator CheB